MRTLGFRTHVLLVLAGAVGVVASLGRPWYGGQPVPAADDSSAFDVHGPLRAALDALQRWGGDPGGTTGWESLGPWAAGLAAVGVAAAACGLGSLAPALQVAVREPLRYLSFAAVAIVAWRLFDPPGPNAALEPRLGALVGAVSALMLWVCAQGVANAPAQRRVERTSYSPPPPPPRYEPR
jgi:hypothetical protein